MTEVQLAGDPLTLLPLWKKALCPGVDPLRIGMVVFTGS